MAVKLRFFFTPTVCGAVYVKTSLSLSLSLYVCKVKTSLTLRANVLSRHPSTPGHAEQWTAALVSKWRPGKKAVH